MEEGKNAAARQLVENWSDKGGRPDGFIYKSRREWQEELSISDRAIRRATAELSKAQDKQFWQVVALQRAAGLRVKEAANIRAQDIDPQTCIIHARKGTKGGRDRDVKVDPQHRQLLADLKAQGERQRDGHVFRGRGSLPDRTQDAVYRACKRLGGGSYGTHGFRKEWTQTRYRGLLAQGFDDRETRWELTRQLDHRRIQVLDHYLP